MMISAIKALLKKKDKKTTLSVITSTILLQTTSGPRKQIFQDENL